MLDLQSTNLESYVLRVLRQPYVKKWSRALELFS